MATNPFGIEIPQAFTSSETLPGLPKAAKSLEKDALLLEKLNPSNSAELKNQIKEHLENDERPGTAALLEVHSNSTLLDRQLQHIEQGTYDGEQINNKGLQIMISPETSRDMLESGRAILTPEARDSFASSISTLNAKLSQHIEHTVSQASEFYADDLINREQVTLNSLNVSTGQSELPFKPTSLEAEQLINRINELTTVNPNERRQQLQAVIAGIMTQRLGVIGLDKTEGFHNKITLLGQELADINQSTVNVDALRKLHTEDIDENLMKELMIYPQFTKALEVSIEQDLKPSGLSIIETPVVVPEIDEPLKEGVTPEAVTQEPLQGDILDVNGVEIVRGINGTAGYENATNSQSAEQSSTRSTERPLEGDILDKDGNLLKEGIDGVKEETQEWAHSHGYENVTKEYTEAEKQRAREYIEAMYDRARQNINSENPDLSEQLNALRQIEKNTDENEDLKLLIRVAVKIGIEMAVIIAKNLAKDHEIPHELRVALGIFADVAEKSSGFADKLISGEDKPNLEQDCIEFIKSKFTKKHEEVSESVSTY